MAALSNPILTIIGKVYKVNTNASRPEQEAFWSTFAATHEALLLAEIEALPPLYAGVLQDHYGLVSNEASSLKSLGEKAGLSVQRMRRMRDEAIERLRLSLKLVIVAEALAEAGHEAKPIQEQLERKHGLGLLNSRRGDIPLFADTYDWLENYQPEILALPLSVVRHLLRNKVYLTLHPWSWRAEITLGEILDKTPKKLLEMPGVGKIFAQEVIDVLAQFNLYLRKNS
jgi:hypothetical protein